MKELVEDAEREKALKDVATATTKEKGKAAKAKERRAQSSEKAWLVAERKLVEAEDRLRGVELKLAEANNLDQIPYPVSPLLVQSQANASTRKIPPA